MRAGPADRRRHRSGVAGVLKTPGTMGPILSSAKASRWAMA